MESPCWIQLLAGTVAPKALMLEPFFSEGYYPMGKTHIGAALEDLHPVERAHPGSVCEGLYPMAGTPLWTSLNNVIRKEQESVVDWPHNSQSP